MGMGQVEKMDLSPNTPGPLTRGAARAVDLSFQHLQVELLRIDLLIRRQVLCWQKAGQDPRDAFRGLYISDSEAGQLMEHPLGANWGQYGVLTAEEEVWFEKALEKAAAQASRLEQAAGAREELRLVRLAAQFGWESFDRDAFLICAAPFFDLKYERLYGYLQDDVTRKRPTVNLILDLLCRAGADRFEKLVHFDADAPLFKEHFLEKVPDQPGKMPLLSQPLLVDEGVVRWLLGKYQPRPEMARRLHTAEFEVEPGNKAGEYPSAAFRTGKGQAILLDGRVRAELEKLTHPESVVVFWGADQLSQMAAAHLVARQMGCPLLTLDLETGVAASAGQDQTGLGDSRWKALRSADYSGINATNSEYLDEIIGLALRDAKLLGAGLFIWGWDAAVGTEFSGLEDGLPPEKYLSQIFGAEGGEEGPSPAFRTSSGAAGHSGLVILGGRVPWQAGGFERDRSIARFEFPMPEYPQRLRLWQYYLDQLGIAMEKDLDLASLAGQFQLTSGQIRDAVASARDDCLQAGTPLGNAELFEAARAYSNPRLASLARKIAPRYTWNDIILPADQLQLLHEIVDTIRRRPKVLDEWGIGQKLASSRGVTVLFAGAPGTGKTMAAEVMAAELGLDLYKIDLSTVISKYIGETEKNLERIFNEAEASNAILFFDEADALFGKRSEVRDSHDRYANVEISYLLQRMEAYNGVTILATNLRSNLDEAFTRRLQFAVDFPFPEEADRLRIWKTLFPPEVPREAGIDLPLLARRFKLAGGNIRNILVTAAYLAASDGGAVNMTHLLHGTRRELQKMGRLVDEEDEKDWR
jgi:hypothetical protein